MIPIISPHSGPMHQPHHLQYQLLSCVKSHDHRQTKKKKGELEELTSIKDIA